jgi:hypothetical protein
VYDFARSLGQGPFVEAVLELLSGLLLVFVFTELITTIRVVHESRAVGAVCEARWRSPWTGRTRLRLGGQAGAGGTGWVER